jgi:signal transduction histidine kinase
MTEVQETEDQLRRLLTDREIAVRHAEEANRAKSSFLAIMSHELRTPLNAIIGFSELMGRELMGPIGNEAYRRYIADIYQSGNLLLGIVNSILDLSRIDSGKQDLKIIDLDLDDVWVPVSSTLLQSASRKGIRLFVSNRLPYRRFAADRNAITQILINLVSNAVKFTQNGGVVEVGLEYDGLADEVAVFVRDNGRGIPANKLADVLSPFVQVSDTYARDSGGVGLGLAICNSLAKAMSGRISLESEIDKGTTVRVILPPADPEELSTPLMGYLRADAIQTTTHLNPLAQDFS